MYTHYYYGIGILLFKEVITLKPRIFNDVLLRMPAVMLEVISLDKLLFLKMSYKVLKWVINEY